VPEGAREQVRLVWLERVDDAIAAALKPPGEREADEPAAAGAQASPGRRAARSL
jgi:ATP-dependent Lon protease